MAKNSKNARRPDARQQAAQRRSGTGATPAQRNAQRRQQRRRRSQSALFGWVAVGVVLAALAVILVLKATGGTSSPTSSATGDAAGRNPAAATAAITGPLSSVPMSVFNSVGTAGTPSTLTVTAGQPKLTSGSLPRFVYEGAEFCPYCAMDRWALATALYRFGTFTGLGQIVSSSTDSAYKSIPTLSFLKSKYTSAYLAFTPYEDEDINSNPLQSVPSDVAALYAKYDGNQTSGTAFSPSGAGIPFIDIANQFVSSGAPGSYTPVATALQGNGLTHAQIALAIEDPTSAVGTAMGAKFLIGEANYLSAGICNVDGNLPATVCTSKGVLAAKAGLKASKPVS